MPQSFYNKNSIHDLAARKRRREKRRLRKRVIFSGWKTNVLNSFCLIAASLLCFAHFEHLQADSDYKLFQLYGGAVFDNLQTNLHAIVCYGHWISALMLFCHLLAIKFAKTRFTFPSLLAFFAWIVNAFLHVEQIHHHDYLISRLAFSAFTVLNTTAVIFLPKKMKRTKRQNTLYSAFSVASTPISQQTASHFNTSQLSFCDRTIDFDDNATMLSGRTYLSTNSTNGILLDRMERNNAWLMENSLNRFNITNNKAIPYATADTMSLRSGKTLSSGRTQSTTFMKWREKNRESTPMREVRQLVDNLFLNNSTEEEDSSGDEKSTLTSRQSNYSVCIS